MDSIQAPTSGNSITRSFFNDLKGEMSRVIMGQEGVIEEILIAFFAGGHVLLEGVPGTAKTLMVRTLSMVIESEFERIQFTPDLMPSDVVGTHVFDMKAGQFYLKKGPIFGNLILADEINRTSPKTQSALLEAMEEAQATIEGEKILLPDPFIVFATQNPIEFEGTYPLPEAQMDRFMFKILVNYPERGNETAILQAYHKGFNPRKLELMKFNKMDYNNFLPAVRKEIQEVTVREEIMDYIIKIVEFTRKNANISLGVSPRGSVALLLSGKTRAAVRGRNYVIPDDIKESAYPTLRHRLILRPEAEIEGLNSDDIIKEILSRVEVPR